MTTQKGQPSISPRKQASGLAYTTRKTAVEDGSAIVAGSSVIAISAVVVYELGRSVPATLEAVVVACIALVVGWLTGHVMGRSSRFANADVINRLVVRLLHAAFNLQARLYNVGRQNFLGVFLTDGSQAEVEYARYNTVYLIGQYLCWAETLRREVQLLAPLHRSQDRDIMGAIEKVRNVLDSRTSANPVLRVFRGDQRAIGEVMVTTTDTTAGRAESTMDCMGYAAFVQALTDDQPGIRRWFDTLLSDIDALARDIADKQGRLVALQHALVDLINFIDPRGQRIPNNLRERL